MTIALRPSPAVEDTTPALRLLGASMAFGGTTVLHGVSLTVAKGEIHALVGRNGSGKSTLIKILSGFHQPMPGAKLYLGNRRFDLPGAPEELRNAGLSFVHQDLGMIPDASIIDNILIGRFSSRGIVPIAWRQERRRVQLALARFGVTHEPDRLVRDLAPVDRALVAIARGFIDAEEHGGVMVLDEPTSFLPEEDVGRLFAAIRSLAAAGTAVIYVSHRLNEVLALADRLTVLRDGRIAYTGTMAEMTEDTIIDHILGESIKKFYPHPRPPGEGVALAAERLSGTTVRDLSLAVRHGEIVGVTGLGGSGYEELPYLLAGAIPVNTGTLRIGDVSLVGTALRLTATRALGLALLPADRQRASGAQDMSLAENVGLPVLDRFFNWGILQAGAERKAVRAVLHGFGVRPADPDAPLRTLSGGNQQKALLGKWVQTKPKVIVLHEPTQGVDIGSKQDIFRKIEQIAADGVAVVIASAEAEDLANLCHRVVVLRRGGVAGELSGEALTEQAINDLALRDQPAAAARSDGQSS